MAIAADAIAHAAMSVAEAPPDAIDVVDDVGVEAPTDDIGNCGTTGSTCLLIIGCTYC